MLTRLLLAVMLALGAFPGAAPCHGAMAMAAHGASGRHAEAAPPCVDASPAGHRGGRHPGPADHACVGCAALDDWLAERVKAPLARPAAPAPSSPPRLALAPTAPPTLRPPRIG